MVPIFTQLDFMKLHGGPFHNKKQQRRLKMHLNGQITYWSGNQLKGVIDVNEKTVVAINLEVHGP
jgi:hypothetical protein